MPFGPTIIVHGGAGNFTPERLEQVMKMVKTAAAEGYHKMLKGGSAVDAVEHAVKCLEDSEDFNTGLSLNRWVNADFYEQEASIMDGATMASGGAACNMGALNPIYYARKIMENNPHVLIAQDDFVHEAIAPDEEIWPSIEEFRAAGKEKKEFGYNGYDTVGAVALDTHGNLAAGTSRGGPAEFMESWNHRVGDAAIIGFGTYADNTVGAISTSGVGTSKFKLPLANCISHSIQKGGRPVNACRINVENLKKRFKTDAGAIAISKNGEVGFATTTPHMPLAYIQKDTLHFGSKMNRIQSEHGYKVHLKRRLTCCCKDFTCTDFLL